MIATPAFDSGSYLAPVNTLAFNETVGSEGFSTKRIFMPLLRTWLWTSNALRTPSSAGFTFIVLDWFGAITQQKSYSAAIFIQITAAGGSNIGRCDGVDTREIRIDIIEIIERFDLPQQDCLIQRPFTREDEVSFDLVLRPIQLMLVQLSSGDPPQFVVNTRLDFSNRVVSTRFGSDMKQGRVFRFAVFRRNKRHRLLAFHQSLVETGGFSFRENDSEYLECIAIDMRDLWGVIGDC